MADASSGRSATLAPNAVEEQEPAAGDGSAVDAPHKRMVPCGEDLAAAQRA
jgi:hypothetical protein